MRFCCCSSCVCDADCDCKDSWSLSVTCSGLKMAYDVMMGICDDVDVVFPSTAASITAVLRENLSVLPMRHPRAHKFLGKRDFRHNWPSGQAYRSPKSEPCDVRCMCLRCTVLSPPLLTVDVDSALEVLHAMVS